MLTSFEIRTAITDYFARRESARLVILFGSAASEKLKAESDIDLALLEVPQLNTTDSVELTLSLSRLVGREIDLVDLSKAHGAILSETIGSGIVLKNSDEDAYEMLINRVLWEHADDSRIGALILSERMKKWQKPAKS
jgi:predicted nucleotidyltransferase